MSEVKLLEMRFGGVQVHKMVIPVHALQWRKLESLRQGKQLVADGQIFKLHAECFMKLADFSWESHMALI